VPDASSAKAKTVLNIEMGAVSPKKKKMIFYQKRKRDPKKICENTNPKICVPVPRPTQCMGGA